MGEITTGFMVTFENANGVQVGQTDILATQPSSQVLGGMLATQPVSDQELMAAMAVVTQLGTDSSGTIVYSGIIAVVWTTTPGSG
jgi:hypothetical protein